MITNNPVIVSTLSILKSISLDLRDKGTLRTLKLCFNSGCGQVVMGAGHKAKRLAL